MLKFIQITSDLFCCFLHTVHVLISFLSSTLYFSMPFHIQLCTERTARTGALIIGSAGCTLHGTSGPGSVYAAESEPALLHRKKCAKFSCFLVARLSVSFESVHVVDKLICTGHITSFLSVTLITVCKGEVLP